jgi:hypothetical protein
MQSIPPITGGQSTARHNGVATLELALSLGILPQDAISLFGALWGVWRENA